MKKHPGFSKFNPNQPAEEMLENPITVALRKKRQAMARKKATQDKTTTDELGNPLIEQVNQDENS